MAGSGTGRLLLVGDSHAAADALEPTLARLVQAAGWTFDFYANVGKSIAWYAQQTVLADKVRQFRPDIVVIVLGTNPTGAYPEQTPATFNQQIDAVLQQAIGTKVYWVGPPTIPRDPADDAASYRRNKILAERRGIQFIDGRGLTQDLNTSRTPDGVHFTQRGYVTWAQRIFDRLTLRTTSRWTKVLKGLAVTAALLVVGAVFLGRKG